MSWKRRTRAVAWVALLSMACSLTMPSASTAFPIKEWMPPAVGDPDFPTLGGFLYFRLGSYSLLISTSPRGIAFLVLIPAITGGRTSSGSR